MFKNEVKLEFKNGLEARAAALFVQLASKFESHILVVVNEKQINAKSIMGMMSLGCLRGESIQLIAEGHDEEEAVKALAEFLKSQEAAV